MIEDENTQQKDMSIHIEHAQKNEYDCILCDSHETHQEQNHYDIEIHTKSRKNAKAIIVTLASRSKGFIGNYDRWTKINMDLCELHYRNLSEHLPLNKENLVDFDEFKELFKSEKKETVQ